MEAQLAITDPSNQAGLTEVHLGVITHSGIVILPLRKLIMFSHALILLYMILLELYKDVQRKKTTIIML